MTIWSKLCEFINLFINPSNTRKVEDNAKNAREVENNTKKITNEIIRHTNLTASPNPFFNFLSDFKARQQREQMNLSGIKPIKKCSSMAIMKAAGKAWRAMTDKQKEPYRAIANKQRKRVLALKKVEKVGKKYQTRSKKVARQTTRSLCRRCPLLSMPKRKPKKMLNKRNTDEKAKKRCLKETPMVKIGNVEFNCCRFPPTKERSHKSKNMDSTIEIIMDFDADKSCVAAMTDSVEKNTDCIQMDSAISVPDTDNSLDSDILFVGKLSKQN